MSIVDAAVLLVAFVLLVVCGFALIWLFERITR